MDQCDEIETTERGYCYDDQLYVVDAKYPLIDDSEPDNPLLSSNTCHILIDRYQIPEKPRFYLPCEEEMYALRNARYSEKFGVQDSDFDYQEIWKSDEYKAYTFFSEGPAESFKRPLDRSIA